MTTTIDGTAVKATTADQSTGEVTESRVILNDDMLSDIRSYEDALRVVQTVFKGEVIAVDQEVGNGFAVVKDKTPFIGVDMMILMTTRHVSSEYKRDDEMGFFYSLFCVCKDGRKVIINDGSTGIADQLEKLYAKHPDFIGKPLHCKKGLRVSRYEHPIHGKAETFYLDTGA